MTKISFCIPCYRSEETIERVIADIHDVMSKKSDQFETEIICVVDGSPDKVLEVLKRIVLSDKTLKIVNLTRNFGQAGARMASLKYATGEYHVCLDDDGQCPIENLWELIDPVLKGSDVSIAKYPHKKQSAFKNFGSLINEKMVHYLLDVPKSFYFSNFWIMRSYITDQVLKYSNPYPYLTGLIAEATNSFAYVEMEEHERLSGTTGYTIKKLINSWLNGALNFSVKPIRIASVVGLFSSLLGFILGLIAIIQKLIGMDTNVGYTSIVSAILITGGFQVLLLGIIGEYVGRTFISLNSVPQFVVKEEINIQDHQE